jgi:hypothetical protein
MEWDEFTGKQVVVDTNSHYVYVGKFESIGEEFLVLTSADCHDSTQSQTTKEVYLIDVKKTGINPNRNRVFIRKPVVVSISLVDDIVEY